MMATRTKKPQQKLTDPYDRALFASDFASRGWSMREMGKRSGVSLAALRRLFTASHNVRPGTFRKVAEAFGEPLSRYVPGAKPPTNPALAGFPKVPARGVEASKKSRGEKKA